MAENRISQPLLPGADVELLNMRKSVGLTVFNSVPDFSQTTGVKDDLTKVSKILRDLAPVMIDTPFQGSSLVMTSDEKRFVFGSREGRLGVVDRDTRQVILDKNLNQGSIWTMTLIENDKYLLSAGASGEIQKLLFSDLSIIDVFEGHSDEINFIQVSCDQKTMYTGSDDRTVRKWRLDQEPRSAQSQTLFEDDGVIYALDLSVDNKFIASAGQASVIVYSLAENRELVRLPNSYGGYMWCIKISTRNSYVAAGDANGVITVWKFGTWEVLKTLTGHTQRVRYMSASLDESFIVTAGLDNDIKIWDMALDRPHITLKGHSNWVKFALISQDQSTVFSISDDKKVASWRIPRFADQVNFPHPDFSFDRLDASSTLIFASVPGKILGYDFKGTKLKEFDLAMLQVVSYEFNPKGTHMYVFASIQGNYKLLGWSLETEARTLDLDIVQDSLYSGTVFANARYAVTGEYVRVNIWDLETKTCIHTSRSHRSNVTDLMVSYDCTRLFASDSSVLQVYDTVNWNEIYRVEIDSPIKFMSPSRDNEYCFISNEASALKIYSLHTMDLIQEIPGFESKKVFFTDDNDYFIHITGNLVTVRDLDNFEKICTIALEFQIIDFSVSPDETLIILTNGTTTTLIANPLKAQNFSIYGDMSRIYEYIEYCNSVMNSSAVHQKEFDSWIIEPYHMNTVHLYSNYNQPKLIEAAVSNHSPFYPSRTGHSPLSIATEKKFVDVIEAVYNGLRLRLQLGDTWAFYHIGDCLVGLNKLGFENLHKIYELGLFRSKDSTLPKFAVEGTKLPVVVSSEHPLMNQTDFPDPSIFQDEGRAVAFGQTSFRMNLVPGSQGSIDLLTSILECENTSIYYTKLVQLILKSKWLKVRWFIGLQACIYVIYLLLLGMYSLWFFNGDNYLIIPLSLSTILFVYEVAQMFNSGLDYFTDMWNYIDLIRGILFVVYCLSVWLVDTREEENSPLNNDVFTLLTLFSWLRGITYFKLFERTRYLIKLIMEASVDILSFFLLLFYSTLAFAFIMQSVDYSRVNVEEAVCHEQGYSITCYFLNSYVQNLGELSASPTNFLTWVLFIIISIVNPVIMLNLLISIMGDTYGRVKAGKVVADAREVAGMVLEVETLMNWNRALNGKTFLKVLCEEADLKTGEKDVDEMVKELGDEIQGLMDLIENGESEIRGELSEAQDRILEAVRNKRGG